MIALLFTKCRRLTLALCLLSAFAGCGEKAQGPKDRARVSGTVTFNGQPLPAGTIGFRSAEGPVATATSIVAGGAYSTDRAPIGNAVVTVDTTSVQVGNPASYVPIPEKYRDPKTSDLTADVKPGENENVDFVLEK